MNEKLKIYLDTSVISYLAQADVPEKMSNTRKLWDIFKSEKYDLYLSTVTLQEIEDCPEPKRSILYQYLSEIKYTVINIERMVSDIASN